MLEFLLIIVAVLVVVGVIIGWRQRNRITSDTPPPSRGERWDEAAKKNPHDPRR